jgi:hypothetical protein
MFTLDQARKRRLTVFLMHLGATHSKPDADDLSLKPKYNSTYFLRIYKTQGHVCDRSKSINWQPKYGRHLDSNGSRPS